VSQSDLADAISFMADPERVKVLPVEGRADSGAQAGAAAPAPAAKEKDFGLFVDPATLPAALPGTAKADAKVVELKSAAKTAPAQAAADASSIRVSVPKVDQLINLVGELVITQAMLAQTASSADPVLYEALFNGLAQLQRNTRDLQEAAMSIRMMPMSFVFSRFPRVVRDVAAKLGKDVDLHTIGEGTELDKGLIERIVDPLTHLVRNSLDHGVESPEERVAKGKVRKGTITLRAYHQGGAIVIEVSDDGRGLRRDKILAKARERGMAVTDAMSDQEVWQLIFEAGFSTADVVTDVSGRGVGMDVVRRNIQEMGGRVEIDSTADVGTRISIKLPLTLAILDGMSVRVGKEIFIIPLGYVSESLQPKSEALSTIGGRHRVVSVRGDYLPVVSLAEVCNIRGDKQRCEDGILVILEAEGAKTALFVDDLVGQHQVVIKSMETNYRKVAGVSGATIMGDGRVAMIMDVAHIVGITHSRLERAA
jgi:two-component system chemotaxis sensor kinase CheA